MGVQGYHRPLPFSSGRASRPPHQPAGLAEGLLLTAHTFGLTVNNKTKSLCTASQTLLHPPGCTAELHDRGWETCAPLCLLSPCWQHQLSSDNKHQWQWKERNLCSKRNKNHATVKTEVTWFCVGNAACPPHALRQVCEEQGGLGTATPGSPLQTTATKVQMAPSGEHPWK